MSEVVRVERDGSVALIVIDNPPVNAGSLAVREGLMAAVRTVESDSSISAAVIMGHCNTFVAGSDIREFGQPIAEPSLPMVIAAIENCSKPFVAAMHGAALGGGLELALGCDARVAQAGTVLGLPEVSLGIIPGAGGTQRLPRLVGVPRAIEMICGGERIDSSIALSCGIIDVEVPAHLRAAAVLHAGHLGGRKRRLRDVTGEPLDEASVLAAESAARKAGRNRPAVIAAIDAVRASGSVPFDLALQDERALFQHLRVSREATALRHVFFAERASTKHPRLDGVEPRPVGTVAVIGAGTMGTGIAIAALDVGYGVELLEQDGEALGRGVQRIHDHYVSRVKAAKLTASEAAARQERLHGTLDWQSLGAADLVIEAVFEDLAIKQQVFKQIDECAKPGAVLASNTSYLDLNAIAAATRRPADVIGLHFFSPANVMRLLEVIEGAESSKSTLSTGLAFGKRLKKTTILAGNAFGFVGNRLYAAYRRQCEFMLEEGAYPEQIDAALEAFGFAMGPFAVGDMSGLDIAWRMRKAQAASRDAATRYVSIPDRLCEAGRLGRKAGAGYYTYADGKADRRPAPVVRQLIDQCRAEKGIVARDFFDDEIVRRAMLALVHEAALLLTEGIAERATDVDVVLVHGYGFPRWEGGPVFWARERSVQALAADFEWLAQVSGPGFISTRPEPLLAAN